MVENKGFFGNLLKMLPKDAGVGEQYDLILKGKDVRVERIVSNGQISPQGFWYDQPEDEWVLVIQGEGALGFEDGTRVMLRSGDHYYLPAHCRHRVEHTSTNPSCVWLAVFFKGIC